MKASTTLYTATVCEWLGKVSKRQTGHASRAHTHHTHTHTCRFSQVYTERDAFKKSQIWKGRNKEKARKVKRLGKSNEKSKGRVACRERGKERDRREDEGMNDGG